MTIWAERLVCFNLLQQWFQAGCDTAISTLKLQCFNKFLNLTRIRPVLEPTVTPSDHSVEARGFSVIINPWSKPPTFFQLVL